MLETFRSPRGAIGPLVSLLLAAGLLVVAGPTGTASADPCGVGGNKVACENTKSGSPSSEWDVFGSGDPSIQGFATDISTNVGSRVDFKIDTDASDYDVTIYRIGYYGGDGARRIAEIQPSASLPQHQPDCVTDLGTDLYDCGNWAVSASWTVPSTAVSGVYLALLERADDGGSSHITFVVRDDSSHSDVVFQTSDTTWQAYNTYGGADFYQGGSHGRAYKISYNRPVLTRDGIGGRDFFFSNEYPMIRFLERNGYDVSYIAGVDTDRRGSLLTQHKTFLSVGHDEYWSGTQRANVEAARDAGVNLQFLSGNAVYWKTRYEPSIDGTSTPHRTLVSYKETWANAKIDPDPEWTGTWRDPRHAPRNRGAGRTENELMGQAYTSNFTNLPLTVPAAQGRTRLWRNTTVATQPAGSTATLAPHTIGYESDEDLDNGMRPDGLIRLSTTSGPVPEYLMDFGNTVAVGTTTHHLTLYRAPSGALVFSAGSVQWTWGLDEDHDSPYAAEPADRRMQQAQVNLFADMGVQPTTLMTGLVAAAKSTDTAKPTVQITSPAAGAARPNGQTTLLQGTASDTGGGVVAGVEVSLDGGDSWSAAVGTTAWAYAYQQKGVGAVPVRVRAIDDSANIGTAVTRSLTVSCPCSVFGTTVPRTTSADDSDAYELGLRFTALSDGFVSGVRFYKGQGNTGTHVGSLWSTSGQRLATVNFTGETATGWQSATFPTAVPVSAGETFIVSYTAPAGHYAHLKHAFSAGVTDASPVLVDGGYGAQPAGLWGAPGTLPNRVADNAAYYVDVTFATTDAAPLVATGQVPLPGSSSVPRGTTVSARFSKPLTAGTARLTLRTPLGGQVPGTTAYDTATRTVAFTPAQPLDGSLAYTATVAGTDTSGNQVTTGRTWSFTTAKPPNSPGVCPCTLFDEDEVPQRAEADDPGPVTLGVRFTTDTRGSVLGIRFYKSQNNLGTHTGALWTGSGTRLATGTFAGESTQGWQTLMFSEPVPIVPGTRYVASYVAPLGRWSSNPGAFAGADLDRAPLHVQDSAGAYTYENGFPQNGSTANYLVDVLFEKRTPAIAIESQDPAPGAVEVPRGTTVRVGLTEPIAAGGHSLTLSVPGPSGPQSVPGGVALSGDAKALTFSPAQTLPADTLVTVALSGVVSTDGVALPPRTWTFRTKAPDSPYAQTLFSDQVPEVAAADDGAPVELGTVFRPARDGQVSAIRFFKGAGNAGTHTGSVWSMTGQRLATVTFAGESATGWQTALLSTPLRVTGGTSYVVSYYAPQGHYAYRYDFFAQPWVRGALTAPAGANGRYAYGGGGGFPDGTHRSTNYYVDVVFVADTAELAITARTPAASAADVVRTVTPSATFNTEIGAGWSMSLSAGGVAVPGTATRSADQRTLTFAPGAPLAAGTAYTLTLTGVESTEGVALGTTSWTFTTESGSPSAVATLLAGRTPPIDSVSDGVPIEVGMAFTSSTAGSITELRFWKGAGNGGTHVGSVWSADGTLLGQVSFTGETSSGWQSAALATPVAVAPGATYVVSYFSPTGHFALDPGYFAQTRASGPLTALPGNGRFGYAGQPQFPGGVSGAGHGYLVDLEFRYSN